MTAAFLYDAAYQYAVALNKTLASNEKPSGSNIIEKLINHEYDSKSCFRTIIALETKFFICELYILSISWSKITWVTGFLRRNVIGD